LQTKVVQAVHDCLSRSRPVAGGITIIDT